MTLKANKVLLNMLLDSQYDQITSKQYKGNTKQLSSNTGKVLKINSLVHIKSSFEPKSWWLHRHFLQGFIWLTDWLPWSSWRQTQHGKLSLLNTLKHFSGSLIYWLWRIDYLSATKGKFFFFSNHELRQGCDTITQVLGLWRFLLFLGTWKVNFYQ